MRKRKRGKIREKWMSLPRKGVVNLKIEKNSEKERIEKKEEKEKNEWAWQGKGKE